MRVVLAVATKTVQRGLSKLFLRLMTLLALNCLAEVLANQFEIRFRVIKSAFVDVYDLCHLALVLGMACAALLLAHTPMVSPQVLYIGGDITMVMTAHTHFILLVFIERLVTTFAVFFETGMDLAQVARVDHDIKRTGR